MTITNAVYTDEDQTSISADIDGVAASIPANAPGNRHWDEIVRDSIPIDPYVPPPVDPIQVSVENLRAQGVTRDTVLAACFVSLSKADNTLLDFVETEIDTEAAVAGVSYADLTNSVMGV